MIHRSMTYLVLAFLLPLLTAPVLAATTYHVQADGGSDEHDGLTPETAFRTIQQAADLAQPGDTVLVYEGVYRERVTPPRGGSSDEQRITYMANPGDHVIITGLDLWTPEWQRQDNLHYATPDEAIFTDKHYVDGGNPYRIGYWMRRGMTLGHVVVDGEEYAEQTNREDANAEPRRWWADQRTGTIYIHFDDDPDGKTVEITTRRGVFRPYLKGLGYITVQGFDLAYCANNGAVPGVVDRMHPLYQSGLISTRQGHHWRIIGNTIRNAKGPGLTFSAGTDIADEHWWDPHGLLNGQPHIEVNYPRLSGGDNEHVPGNSQIEARPFKEAGFCLIANNDFHDLGASAICGIGSLGNTIYGNRFANVSRLVLPKSAEDGVIKLHMQFGTLIERNLFEDFAGDHRAVWLDNNAVGSVVSRNVFLEHPGRTPVVFLEISSSLDQYLSVIDHNIFINCAHAVVSAGADGVALYHNLVYGGESGFAMGSNRHTMLGADYGNMRIHVWNNLFVDQQRAYGFGYNQAINHHTADFNLMYAADDAGFHRFLLSDGGTGDGPGEHGKPRPNVVQYSIDDIDAARAGDGKHWEPDVNWGANNAPNGVEADLVHWRHTMGDTIDRHSEERIFEEATYSGRAVTLFLGSEPSLTDAPVMPGAMIDFQGQVIRAPVQAGPVQGLGADRHTITFWDDEQRPALPDLPTAPSDVVVTVHSDIEMRVQWTNHAPDARFMHIERRINDGEWEFWGYITTTQNHMRDYDLDTRVNSYDYRIAARNAAGLSDVVEGARADGR
ncbi:MAG: hypothetical protein WDZ31_03670 [Phycisphaeraceae bacterium]